MSTLHEKLLNVTESGHPGDGVDDHEPRLYAAVRAVVELHAPIPCPGFPCLHLDPHNVCKTCGSSGTYVIGEPNSTARCSTITAIASALGVEIGDTP